MTESARQLTLQGRSTTASVISIPSGPPKNAALCRGIVGVTVDGITQPDDFIALTDDGLTHEVSVIMGEKAEIQETASVEGLKAERS